MVALGVHIIHSEWCTSAKHLLKAIEIGNASRTRDTVPLPFKHDCQGLDELRHNAKQSTKLCR